MICKHVDVIAIAILLFAIALVSSARHVAVFAVDSGGRMTIYDRYHAPHVMVPEPPRLPFTRD